MLNKFLILIIINFYKSQNNETRIYSTNRPFNQYTWLVAHNAFMSPHYGWFFYIRQQYKITKLLELGIRGINLDIFFCKDTNKICLCHTNCEKDGINGPFITKGELFLESVFNEIGNFLIKNKNEVVTLIFEDYITNSEVFETFFRNSKFFDMILDIRSVDTERDTWPTLDWMINNNKRILIFTDEIKNTNNSFAFYLWDYLIENTFDMRGKFEICIKRDSSDFLKNASTNGKNPYKLFVFNHISWSYFTKCRIKYNNSKIFLRWENYCKTIGIKIPNYVMVDMAGFENTMNAVDYFNKLRNK